MIYDPNSAAILILAASGAVWIRACGGICSEVSKMAKKTQAEKTAQNDETAKSNDDPMNDDEEPNFSDPEGFVDDITDEGK